MLVLLLALAALQAPAEPRRGACLLLGPETAFPADLAETRRGAHWLLRIAGAPGGDAERLGASGARVLELARGDVAAVDDRALAAELRAAGRIVLAPAPLADWYLTLWPNWKESALLGALREAWRDGATVVGAGPSAALLSAAAIVEGPGEVLDVERNPRRGAERVAWGLALQPWAVFDAADRSGGSLTRLLEVSGAERMRLSLFVPRGGAVLHDAEAARLVGLGDAGALVFDLRRSRGRGGSLGGLRCSRLTRGDRWDRRARAVEPAPGRRRLAVGTGSRTIEVDGGPSADALLEAVDRLAAGPAGAPLPGSLELRGHGFRLTLVLDATTRVLAGDAGEPVTLDRALMELERVAGGG